MIQLLQWCNSYCNAGTVTAMLLQLLQCCYSYCNAVTVTTVTVDRKDCFHSSHSDNGDLLTKSDESKMSGEELGTKRPTGEQIACNKSIGNTLRKR